MFELKISEVLIVLATLVGPIAAVQAQKFVERATERRRQKLRIFYALMGTRAARVSPEHVHALNQIELEFSGARFFNLLQWQTPREKTVIDAWRVYSDKLSQKIDQTNAAAIEAWQRDCDQLFTDLLLALSRSLGFNFDRVQLRKGVYSPRAHGDAETLQREIQENLAKLLTGQSDLRMNVVGFPVSEDAIRLQQAVQQAIIKAISDGVLQVKVRGDEPGNS